MPTRISSAVATILWGVNGTPVAVVNFWESYICFRTMAMVIPAGIGFFAVFLIGLFSVGSDGSI